MLPQERGGGTRKETKGIIGRVKRRRSKSASSGEAEGERKLGKVLRGSRKDR